jgi:phosphatidylserine/phosphatidylglycerophosphate/cardiolipin synthase-like enzyme
VIVGLVIAELALAGLPVAGASSSPGRITFVESVPVETTLDLPDVPDAPGVWLDLVRGARRELDVFTFYFSPDPAGGDALSAVLAEVEAAGARGVNVKLLSDAGFHKTYPETHDRFANLPGVESRLLDARAQWGGILHAKGMIVDRERFFLGSQNWDWRSLTHIHELGAVVEQPEMAADLARIFALDWSLALGQTGGEATATTATTPARGAMPDTTSWATARALQLPGGGLCEAVLAASPRQALPEGIPWDLPLLVETIDAARDSLHLQMLSYDPSERGGKYWPILDDALRAAAARGVTVRLIFSNWAKRASSLKDIQSLAVLPNLEVRFTNIPAWSGGFVPFARVDHAKFVTADGCRLWLGTANGSRDYFEESRNVSLFLRGPGCTAAADAFFDRGWRSAYAEVVDPCGTYTPPPRD